MQNYVPEELDDFRSETPQAYFRYVDGILSIELKGDQIIDLLTVQRIEHVRKEMTMYSNTPVMLVIPANYLLLDRDAFQYLGSAIAMEGCVAKAVVIPAPLRVLLLNFSLAFYRQATPFRLFSSRSDAKMWLFGHLQLDELRVEL